MKNTFCVYQNVYRSEYDGRIIYECAVYGKECPYTKLSKAEKKCQELIHNREDTN